MKVSLILTVLNEVGSIAALMDSIAAQTRPPDEVVVADGGSTDGTLTVLQPYADRLPLTVLSEPGCNISQGRNEAIRAASGEVIAVTDAGVRLDSGWLAELLAPFEAEPDTQVVAGFFLPDVETPFEVAMGATVLPALSDVNPASFLPSSRSVAFRAGAWRQVGGYPEWLDYCEDLVFDLTLRVHYGRFTFAPGAVAHFRPRASLRAFARQYYQYARGDGKADLWLARHLVRYATYLLGVPLIALAGALLSPWWWALYFLGAVFMFGQGYRRLPRLWGNLPAGGRLLAALWVPLIRVTGDVAKMAGYPVGLVWRARERPPDWRAASHTNP
jgi:glycosyltransferase involved in cell wall biosynthesis